MKHLFPLQLAALVVLSAQVAPAQESTARQHIDRGLMLASNGDTLRAFAQFERAIDVAPDLADAHYQLGRLYVHRASSVETDFRDRQKAEKALLKALKLSPDDPRYLLELGRLRLKQHMKIDAERLLDLALSKAEDAGDPAVLAEVHFMLGYLRELRYLGMRNRRFRPLFRGPPVADIHRMYESRVNRYVNRYLEDHPEVDRSGSLERDRMVEHYRAALRSDPAHVAAATRLMGHLLDEMRLAEYLAVARRLLAANPDRPEPHLYLGLGYHAAGREDDATRAFEDALARLRDEDRAAIENLATVLRREDAENYLDLTEPERNEFEEQYWALLDPLYLTDANERRLEHLARVAYADLRFSAPSAGLRGWESDRGVIFIRYGPPVEIASFGADVSNRGDRYAVGRRSIVWSYGDDGPVFIFRQMPGYLDARFAGDYEYIAENYRYLKPASYENIPSIAELIPLPVQVARFRGKVAEELSVEIHADVPFDSMARGLDVERGEVETGLFILNETGETVIRRMESQVVRYADADEVDDLRSWRLVMPTGGMLVAAVEARDAMSWRAASSRDTFTAAPFVGDSLAISDILVADFIRPLREKPVTRSDFDIVPNPALKFEPGDPVNIYFELYGLDRDPEGYASYDVALAVRVKKLYRHGAVSEFLGALADAWGFSVVGDDRLELRFSREVEVGDRDRVVEFLELNLERAPAGEYEIRLRVWDRLGEELTSRIRPFRVGDVE